LIAPSFKRFANISAFFECSPTTILEGYKLSYKAFPSLRNSGEKMILKSGCFSRCSCVYPTGIVDLIMIVAFELYLETSKITLSTVDVSK
jgi:hypothetical protein